MKKLAIEDIKEILNEIVELLKVAGAYSLGILIMLIIPGVPYLFCYYNDLPILAGILLIPMQLIGCVIGISVILKLTE